MKPIITALAYEIGELHPIHVAARKPSDEDAINTLKAIGHETFSRATVHVADLAAASMRKTLQRGDIAPRDVDAVVFGSESLWDVSPAHQHDLFGFRNDMYAAISSAGVLNAYAVGCNFTCCANSVNAISLAADMVRSGEYQNVLVVIADRHPEERSRIMLPAVAILGDGAASCLVTSRPAPGFAIEHIVKQANMQAWNLDVERDFAQFLVLMAQALKKLGARMVERSGRSATAYQYLLTNNYSRSALRVFCHQLGYEQGSVYVKNIPRLGHAYACDLLMNLHDVDAQGSLQPGARLMALATGPVSCAMMDVRKHSLA
jgi:3-oxoacyl-[acyl-carrier-protein] synthase III